MPGHASDNAADFQQGDSAEYLVVTSSQKLQEQLGFADFGVVRNESVPAAIYIISLPIGHDEAIFEVACCPDWYQDEHPDALFDKVPLASIYPSPAVALVGTA